MTRYSFVATVARIALAVALLLAIVDVALNTVIGRTRWVSEVVDIQTPSILLAKIDYLRKFDG